MSVATQQRRAAFALPLGRRVPTGTVRWYLVRCHEGRELSTCEDLACLMPEDLLQDCFVPRIAQGPNSNTKTPLFKGYLIVATSDAPALAKELAFISTPAQLVGQVGRGYAPIAREAQEFLTAAMDQSHVIRTSCATVDRTGLHVTSGPLVGQERRMGQVGPRSRSVRVVVGGSDGEPFAIDMPVSIQVAPEATREVAGTPFARRKFAGTSLPLGRRTPRGRLRWYLVECSEGTEAQACEAVRAIMPASVLADAYVPMTERIKKVHGEWVKPVSSLVPGSFVAATTNPAALKVELERVCLPLRLAGQGSAYQPLDDDAWGLVQSLMDDSHTIRESRGEIVADQLRVWSGPLAGRESVVSRYIRRQSLAFVDLGNDQAGAHTLLVPLSIVARR